MCVITFSVARNKKLSVRNIKRIVSEKFNKLRSKRVKNLKFKTKLKRKRNRNQTIKTSSNRLINLKLMSNPYQ